MTKSREMNMETVRILKKGQFVIPAALRKKYGIRPGCRLRIFEYGRMLHLVPPSDDPVLDAMGCLPGEPSLTAELLEERRRDPAV
jgi:AbrB family looped-hinge helix DNA binding protein